MKKSLIEKKLEELHNQLKQLEEIREKEEKLKDKTDNNGNRKGEAHAFMRNQTHGIAVPCQHTAGQRKRDHVPEK